MKSSPLSNQKKQLTLAVFAMFIAIFSFAQFDVIRDKTDNAQYHFNYARICMDEGSLDGALKSIQKALSYDCTSTIMRAPVGIGELQNNMELIMPTT